MALVHVALLKSGMKSMETIRKEDGTLLVEKDQKVTSGLVWRLIGAGVHYLDAMEWAQEARLSVYAPRPERINFDWSTGFVPV